MGEVALSIVLLVCAALLLQTLNRLQTVRTGFVPEGLLTIRIVKYQAGTRDETAALLSATHARVLEAIRRVPGVVSASVTNGLPYTGTQTDRSRADISIRGRSREETKTISPLAGADVGPDYFTTMRIPLARGRLFDETDTATSPKVVIINERAAKRAGAIAIRSATTCMGLQSIESVLPRRGHSAFGIGRQRRQRHRAVHPHTQWPARRVSTRSEPLGDIGVIGTRPRAIRSTDRTAAVAQIKTMEQRMGESVWQEAAVGHDVRRVRGAGVESCWRGSLWRDEPHCRAADA